MVSALPCIKLVHTITQSNLDINQQEIEIKHVFVNILKNGPLDTRIIQGFETLICIEFNRMQDIRMLVYRCLQEVYQALGIQTN